MAKDKFKDNVKVTAALVNDQDFQIEQNSLTQAAKTVFAGDENAQVKVYDHGYKLSNSHRHPELKLKNEVVVIKVEILGPGKKPNHWAPQ